VRIIAIVQARFSTKRFPGKALADLGGMPVIVHLCRRLQQAGELDDLLVATSGEPEDDPLVAALEAAGIAVHRAPLENMLEHLAGATRKTNADAVVRIGCDRPFVDPEVIDAMVKVYRDSRVDYYSNISPRTFPDGLDVEIISSAALARAAREAATRREREHVTPYLREHPEIFSQDAYVDPSGDHSQYRLCVDREGDLELLREILACCNDRWPRLPAVLAVLQARPELAQRARAAITAQGDIADFMAELDAAAPAPRIAASEKLWRRAEALIPAGTQTLSKGPTQFVRGFAPKYLVRGEGCNVWDADGNRYIDYPMGLGAVTLGHARPEVVEAVQRQLAQGTALSLMHPLEVELAERICTMVPCAERVRFGKNGSDATSACIRAARALTGREHVARCGYHGWHDWALDESHGVRARGVPAANRALTHSFAYNDAGSLRSVLAAHACAAVILEPVSDTPPAAGFLEEVRDAAHQAGALLIFDEVITGFRYARGGAQEYFGVIPDLACMGKGVANGLPLSIVCGRREAMKIFEEVFFSLTFGGETTALAAAMATLGVMEREDYWAHAWRIGTKLQLGYRNLAARFRLDHVIHCAGMAPWTIVQFRDAHGWSSLQFKTLFQQEMIRRGVLFSGSQFLSLAHTDAVIDETLDACREAFRVLRYAIDYQCVHLLLRGKVNELVFRRN
jgi:glutamate-1-semialdehyde 2,1-aminomutase/spore coat polysaccharide biosynthesis protein SpsF